MATVPPGPSEALLASPADSHPFSGDRSAQPVVEDGQLPCLANDCVSAGTRDESHSLNDVKRSVKRKQKGMLTQTSPAVLHLKPQSGEQQLNGVVSPSEEPDVRPESLRSPADTDSGDGAPAEREGPVSENGAHLNGMPDFSRSEAARGADKHKQPSRPPGHESPDAAGPGGGESSSDPPAAELARLDLSGSPGPDSHGIRYVRYESELQMPWIMRLITKDLSEPYSIYTYRYFIHNWPQLCFLAMVEQECVGAIVCKLDMHKKMFRRGYIAMLAVDSKHRRKSIGTNLVKKAIYAMVEGDCDEVVLETEITNKSALKLYENLGFVRDKRLFRYYLNGVDALRLKLWLR
uniref:N-alpha-acetyltransferase 30 n=1 Tax=Oryzias latipes TaxID=8090 RepID=A0A3P9H640_ORYLA